MGMQQGLSPLETSTITALVRVLVDFLPGNPHPYANAQISFRGAAADAGLPSNFWSDGSKGPALALLLERTLLYRRSSFCKLLSTIVSRALVYRQQKKNPLRRGEVEQMNAAVARLGFKIPELWDPEFLHSLVGAASGDDSAPGPSAVAPATTAVLKDEFQKLLALPPHARGYAFEHFLHAIFAAFRLQPRNGFRLAGEQIDGSFDFSGTTYLLEAKFQQGKTIAADLSSFAFKVKSKTSWSRGLFVSYGGFSADGLDAYERGGGTDIVCMDGADLWAVVNGAVDLRALIEAKVRRAAETGHPFVSARELFVTVT